MAREHLVIIFLLLFALFFRLLTLIEGTKGVILNGIFFLLYDFATVQTLPSLKIDEMVEERLHYHESLALRAFH